MSEGPDTPPEPPRPQLGRALARAVDAESPQIDVDATAGGSLQLEGAPPNASVGESSVGNSASTDDPELPGVDLATRIEALLFVATEPLALRRLKELLRVEEGRIVRDALDRLAGDYAASGRAMRVEEVAGGFQLRTRPELAPMVARVGRKVEAERLSPAALETMAIVAYRQPVLRADIERIRGVASGEVLRALVERGLVRIAGRAELPGSPIYYGTTTRFLEIFGLRDLKDLPQGGEGLGQPG